jgi:beta-glucanase (GH16 family)
VTLLDEAFDGTLDTEVFGFEEGYSVRNGDAEAYTSRAENVFLDGGQLVLRARAETYGEAAYTSASLTTEGKLSFTYGKVEARIWAPDGAGTGPAFWLMPESPGAAMLYCSDATTCVESTWPVWGDIVVMTTRSETPTEIIQSSNYGVYDATRDAVTRGESGGTTIAATSIADGYHDYAIVWGPRRIDWYFDGELTQTFDTSRAYRPENQPPFERPFYIRLNLAVGGLAEPPDPSAYPQDMRVEYLRVTAYE